MDSTVYDNGISVTSKKNNLETVGADEMANIFVTMMEPNSISSLLSEAGISSFLPPQVDDESIVIDIFALIEQKRREFAPDIKITPLSVSTQSAKARMSIAIPLRKIANSIYEAVDDNIVGGKRKDFHIIGVEYQDITIGPIKKRVVKNNGKGRQFPNNCTILVRSPMGTGRTVNIKVFQNGSISMTGCKIKEDGIAVTKILEKFLIKQTALFESKQDAQTFRIKDFEITMINSNYSIGFDVERQRLYDIFIYRYPGLDVTYDPSSYSGVKIRFFYNSSKKIQDGVCRCQETISKICHGKGTGERIGQCKVVTVAVFQTGKVINTGARNLKQTIAAYDYVNSIICDHAEEFVHISLSDLEKDQDEV